METWAGTTGVSQLRGMRDSVPATGTRLDACARTANGVRGLGAAMAVGGTGLALLPAVGPLCPLRRTTGVPCPVCGMTTGVFAMIRGDVGAAFMANPLAPLLLAIVLLAFVPPLWRQAWRGFGAIRSALDAPDEASRSRWWMVAPVVFGLWLYQLHRFDHL